MRATQQHRGVGLALICIALGACGGGDNPPKTPVKQPVPAGQNPAGPAAPQVGMSDTPSSGGMPDAGRPQMNAAAAGLYQQGLQAFANLDLAGAKNFFTQATAADPKAHQAYYSLGVVQERLKDAGASSSYRQAYTLVPDYEPAIIAYAMLLAKKGSLSDADRFLTEKRGQMPKSAAVAAALAEVKSINKDTGSAQRIAQEALKINPDYRPAMVIIARDHYRARRIDLATYALAAILDGFDPKNENPPRDKDNPEAHLLRGIIYREQGLRAASMEEFKAALGKRPDLVDARVALGTFLLEAGNAPEAQGLLEGAIRLDADNTAAHLALGDTYRLLGRYADAKTQFDWVVSHDASLPQVHYDLGLMYLFAPSVPGMNPKQQVAEAIKELKKFQDLRSKGEPDDSDELLNRAKSKEGELNAGSTPVPEAAPSGSAKAGPAGSAAAAPAASGAPAASAKK